jgi:uncharacterized FAD-dependent dehydrogenase
MCPGGIIAPAATAEGEIVVNGWSPSKRNNPYANSGIVVTVDEANIQALKSMAPGRYVFSAIIEQKAFEAGGGKLVAPAQRMVDLHQQQSFFFAARLQLPAGYSFCFAERSVACFCSPVFANSL